MALFSLRSVVVVAWFGLLVGCPGGGDSGGTATESGGTSQCQPFEVCPSGDCPNGVGCEDELGKCEAGLCDCVLGRDMCCEDGSYPPCVEDEPPLEDCSLFAEAEPCGAAVGCGWVQTAVFQTDFRDLNSCTKPEPDGSGVCIPSSAPPCPDPNAFACGAGSEMVFFVAPTIDGSDGTRVLTLDSAYACVDPVGFLGCSNDVVGGGSTAGDSDSTTTDVGGSDSVGTSSSTGGTGPSASTSAAPTSGGTASYDTSSGGDTDDGGPPLTDICNCLCGVG